MKQVSIPCGASLTDLYRQWAGDYPKFFKMDTLSKLGFLLAEMLVHDEPERFTLRCEGSPFAQGRNSIESSS